MRKIIDLLLEVEQLAGNMYCRAADKYSGDKEFNVFLSRMAGDEDLHYQLIKDAEEQLLNKDDYLEAAISIDQGTIDRIKAPLLDFYNRINSEVLTKEATLKIITDIEFSELNHIFMYVVNTFQEDERRVQQIAASVQAHKNRIEEFIEKHSGELDPDIFNRKLPEIWKKKLLVIDDLASIRIVVADILEDIGSVETAENGFEALEKVRDTFFDVIISDIGMPIMDGVELFKNAIDIDPDIKNHFMFFSGNITPSIDSFCRKHHLICLRKPFTIPKLRSAVQEIIDRN